MDLKSLYMVYTMSNRVIVQKLEKHSESLCESILKNVDKIKSVIIPKIQKAISDKGWYDDFRYVKVDEKLELENGDVLSVYGVLRFTTINMDDDLQVVDPYLYCNYNGKGTYLSDKLFSIA